ncbi:hypothetical protein JB92DRAFT_2616927, partial [Gautieria morchelliformis]
PGHVPRPPNAFILFRSHFCETPYPSAPAGYPADVVPRRRQVVGVHVPEEKKPWHDEARKVKDEHKLRYPEFQYRPTR